MSTPPRDPAAGKPRLRMKHGRSFPMRLKGLIGYLSCYRLSTPAYPYRWRWQALANDRAFWLCLGKDEGKKCILGLQQTRYQQLVRHDLSCSFAFTKRCRSSTKSVCCGRSGKVSAEIRVLMEAAHSPCARQTKQSPHHQSINQSRPSTTFFFRS